MPSTSDLKRGVRIELDGDPYVVTDISVQSPSARGAATLIKTKLRNLRSKQLVSKTFKSGERLKDPNFEVRPCQYIYAESNDTFYFMDSENYEQFPLKRDDIETELGYIRENDEVRAVFFDGACIGVEVPNTVELEVKECDPGVKGDTVTNVTKSATLETGLEIQVPLFVNPGDKLVVDTREARYVRRA
ncbi:MAG: elongation factor P [Proteobacteria bacterium]|nr:MAG: elongation factor P [Pseudomonadota bacterium]PIE19975.1 MAG: elongation factor P [Pseudomonadota bacterium]